MVDFDYSITHLFEDIADTNSALLRVQTGENGVKGIIPFSSDGQCKIEVQSETTFSDDGTEEDVYERNEMDSRTTKVNAWYDPTVDSAGETEDEGFVPGGGRGRNKVGGKYDGDTLTWKKNTEHLIKATNTSGSESDIWIKVLFNEV